MVERWMVCCVGMEWAVRDVMLGCGKKGICSWILACPSDDFEKIRREPSSLSLSLKQEDSIGVSYDPHTTLAAWTQLVIGLSLSLGRRLGLVVD